MTPTLVNPTPVTLRGYTFGDAEPIIVDGDNPITFGPSEHRSAEEPMPNRDGVAFGGADLAGGRDLLISVRITTSGPTMILDMIDAVGDLAQAWRPADTDLILSFTLGGARTFVCYGRPRPLEAEALRHMHAGLIKGVLRFRMARPWIHDANTVESTVTVLPAATPGGLGYPHGYPHGYEGDGVTGQVTHTAGGRLDTWPLVVLKAGALDTLRNPTVHNDASGESVGLDTTVVGSEQLVIDMYRQRVYATQVGADVTGADPTAVAVADRSSTVRHPTDADFFQVAPDATNIRLTGAGEGTATIITRAAYYL